MHLLVDALSVNNLSGRHVLLGHLQQLRAGLGDSFRFTLLTHRDNSGIASGLPDDIQHVIAPVDGGWLARSHWMWRHARSLCDEHAVDLVFSPAGLLSVGADRPQIVLAQNPWPLLPGMARGSDRIKAMLQRRAYARAQRVARMMVFNSRYMQDLYQERFGASTQHSIVAYQGVDEFLFAHAEGLGEPAARPPLVLTVSVMARHKAIEVLVDAFATVAAQVDGARLLLVGAWPDAGYRDEVVALIDRLGLAERVELLGHVAQAELVALYRDARVFCLPSRCESFGIPAIEAQVFGTPTVVADGTAAPEIAGPGGTVVRQDDVAGTAAALRSLLADDAAWKEASARARTNAQRFRWRDCSAPLLAALQEFQPQSLVA